MNHRYAAAEFFRIYDLPRSDGVHGKPAHSAENDIAASFFWAPVLFPNSPSIPFTNAGTNAIPRSN